MPQQNLDFVHQYLRLYNITGQKSLGNLTFIHKKNLITINIITLVQHLDKFYMKFTKNLNLLSI